ncbi:Ser/Thr phosphatase family protein [Nitrosotalea sinensis]|jgi:DNA repair exonuclease SbcCD nuclease subunit|uniref:DNA double-strand break repair protein Mre11 n=1 Tax=Nitrosotalea sinensis TaxID=1499975 RepID=A0A2H1EI28_9ARCH|nr:exonuclease SbcCD subunit D [Candidatus Nitrosotalea sinensis]SHO46239.1 Ser/Thr phosphatase family protein [Candidatus Nitrosotalea sinensis]
MIFSHISDTHLGFVQYHSEERENDVYTAFDQAIDTSIKDHVDFVLLAGDIFHVPNPSGKAILVLANALRRLKKNNIDSYFILGEHDISRIRSTPVPFVYHNLGFSKYIGDGNPIFHKDVLIAGFDKRRKAESESFEPELARIDAEAKKHQGHKILVLHQGITEVNKFAGELNSSDLPKNFTYYAMGHLHEHELRQFSHLGGPLAYPGSIELTSSEGIKETEKGFYQVDISTKEASPTWIKLDIRTQLSIKTSIDSISNDVNMLMEKIRTLTRKPVVELKITGKMTEPGIIQSQVARLTEITLRCFWKHISQEQASGSVFIDKPLKIEEEMQRIAKEILGSTEMANFAINELLPLLSKGNADESSQAVIENFEKFKKGARNVTIS